MSEKQMTAVEFMVEELDKSIGLTKFVDTCDEDYKQEILGIIQQAKEMEEEQSLKMPEYDLDELARKEILYNDQKREWWKLGFQKALELLTFKSE